MAELPKIYTGWDCTKDYRFPTRKVHIEPRTKSLAPDELIYLKAVITHDDCDESCYTWRHVSGGGRLMFDTGKTTIYVAPEDNPHCKNSAVIELSCAGKKIASSYLTVNTYLGPLSAYEYYPRSHKFSWTEPDYPWPPPHLKPPPPWDPPPKHVKFTSDVVFPLDWKPGDSLPPGATVDLNDLIPDDWVPGNIPPDGVRIPPLTVFPPGWKKGDPFPEGVTVSTLTLFPPDWKAHFPASFINLTIHHHNYDCSDNYQGTTTDTVWHVILSWNKRRKRWQILISHMVLYKATLNSMSEISWESIYGDRPYTKDVRRPYMIEAGCCPAGLLPKDEEIDF